VLSRIINKTKPNGKMPKKMLSQIALKVGAKSCVVAQKVDYHSYEFQTREFTLKNTWCGGHLILGF
jgi:hypothetical protein